MRLSSTPVHQHLPHYSVSFTCGSSWLWLHTDVGGHDLQWLAVFSSVLWSRIGVLYLRKV